MNKYIDSEKLIAELTRMQFDLNAAYRHPQSDSIVRAISLEYDDILSLVDSLQQEQPVVDFEKAYKSYMKSRKDDLSGNAVTVNMKDMARYFYELGRLSNK